MTKRTRTQITIQTRQTIVVRPLQNSSQVWCEQCLDMVPALTLESAVGLLRILPDRLYELLQCGKVHTVEANARLPSICCNSLSANSTKNEILFKGEDR